MDRSEITNCRVCGHASSNPCQTIEIARGDSDGISCFYYENLPGEPRVPERQSFDDVPTLPALGTQVGGSHYKDMAIQPMTYSMANGLDACQHTIVKYVSRFRSKNGIEDLEKAKHCLDLLIEFEKGKLK